MGTEYGPRGKMENIQESSKGITGDVANLGLVHERFIEEIGRILFLAFLLSILLLLAILFLHALLRLDGGSRDVKSHLDQLIGPRSRLATPIFRASSWLSVGSPIGGQVKLDGDFVLSRKVRVGDFGVRDLERWSVLDVEG